MNSSLKTNLYVWFWLKVWEIMGQNWKLKLFGLLKIASTEKKSIYTTVEIFLSKFVNNNNLRCVCDDDKLLFDFLKDGCITELNCEGWHRCFLFPAAVVLVFCYLSKTCGSLLTVTGCVNSCSAIYWFSAKYVVA